MKNKYIRMIYTVMTVCMCILFLYGIFGFFTAPAKAKKAMDEIQEMLEKQQEAADARKQEVLEAPAGLAKFVGDYEDSSEMRVTIIGDSVTLAALDALCETFPNGNIDAVFGRTIYEGMNALEELEENNQLGDVLVFSLGTNCETYEDDWEWLIEHSHHKTVFFVTTYGVGNDSNEIMTRVANRHENVFVIDWETPALANRSEWILADGLHPNEEGSAYYAYLIHSYINRYCILLRREARKVFVP